MATSAKTEEYDGTTWTDGNDMLTGENTHAISGTQTAAISSGGWDTRTVCQEYDGTSWTAGGSLTGSGRAQHYSFGTLANTIVTGGNGALATSEQYDGSSWSSVDNIPAGRQTGASFGSAGIGIIVGGQNSSDANTTTTYKYVTAVVTARTLSNS